MTTRKSLKDGFALFGTTLSVPLAAAAAAALLVTGCGGDDGPSPSASAATAAATTSGSTSAATDATTAAAADQPYVDTDVYGTGPNDAVTDSTEGAAVVHRQVTIGGKTIKYTATTGHLTTIDPGHVGAEREDVLRRVHAGQSGPVEAASGHVLLQRRPRFVVGLPAARLVRAEAPAVVVPELHAARAVQAARQPGQPARPHRSRVHQPGRHRLFDRDRTGEEQGLLGHRPGRALDRPLHSALPDQVLALEFAEVPVRRVVRHRAQRGRVVGAARGRHRPERDHAAVVDPRLCERAVRAGHVPDARGRRVLLEEDDAQPDADRSRRVHGPGPQLRGQHARAARAEAEPAGRRLRERAAEPEARDRAADGRVHRHGPDVADPDLRQPGRARQRAVVGRQPAVHVLPDAGAGHADRPVRRSRELHGQGHRAVHPAELGQQRSVDHERRRRVHGAVEQLHQHRPQVHVDVVVRGPERPGLQQLGLQSHRPDRREQGGRQYAVHGRRPGVDDEREPGPEGAVGERLFRRRHAVPPDGADACADAARSDAQGAEPDDQELPVGPHDLPERRVADRAEGRSRQLLRRYPREPHRAAARAETAGAYAAVEAAETAAAGAVSVAGGGRCPPRRDEQVHSRNAGRCFRSRALVTSLLFRMPRESWTPGALAFVSEQRASPRKSRMTAHLILKMGIYILLLRIK
ncbi:hypothetical protein BCPG_00912 [Burkholderia cenocepacia PC184]|nr:hypothetical protein BCPG_00912 [Burkholderia cenocepacia PC184]